MPSIDQEKRFSVFVGGAEVNDFYLTEEEADRVYHEYLAEGYDDVQMVDMEKERG